MKSTPNYVLSLVSNKYHDNYIPSFISIIQIYTLTVVWIKKCMRLFQRLTLSLGVKKQLLHCDMLDKVPPMMGWFGRFKSVCVILHALCAPNTERIVTDLN
jgi:hypothetical protein